MNLKTLFCTLAILVVAATSATVSQAVVVTQYSFENNLLDTGLGGTADNLSVVGAGRAESYEVGIVGNAVRIDTGANDAFRLRALTSPDLNLAPSFTLEAFVNPDSNNVGDFDRFWTKWGDADNDWHWTMRGGNNGLDLFEAGTNRLAGATNPAANTVPLNEWSHIAVVGDNAGSTLTAFINGNEVATGTYVVPTAATSAMNFGNFSNNAGDGAQFSGLVDEARIHNTALTQSELKTRALLAETPDPTTGLLSFYQFEGDGTDTASNFTPNVGTTNDNLSVVGGAVNFVPGKVGLAVDLNGGFLQAANSSDQNPGNAFTIEGWINPDTINGTFQRVVMKWSPELSYHFGIRGDDVNLFLSSDGAGATEVATGGSLVAGEWQHIAATSDGNTVRVFLNGLEVGSGLLPAGGLNFSNSPFGIGDIPSFNGFRYQGLLDEFALWNLALTPEQLRSHFFAMEAGFEFTRSQSAVPEPTSLALISLAGVAMLRRRRQSL